MALTPEQKSVLAAIKQVAAKKGASPKQVKAAIETGLVESNLTNIKGGDADSSGWRQERASIYKDPNNLTASIGRFFDETAAVKDQYGTAGALAAAVQRPAAQYRGRYQQQSSRADQLRGFAGKASGAGSAGSQGVAGSSTTTTAGVDNSAARQSLVAQFLADKSADPVQFALQARQLKDVAPTTTTTRSPATAPSESSPTATDFAKAVQGRAAAINSQHLPYSWGGGHGVTTAKPGTPLDCSGAVSKVLGISPRVSGALESYGDAGKGKNVTIYANGHHTLMEINGHFWGTSASNPGGGAGWIPRSQISSSYLQGFTARHPPGQ